MTSPLDVDALRNLTLAVPLAAVTGVLLWRNATSGVAGRVPGAALATLWAWCAVLAVEQVQQWWRFAEGPSDVLGMPLETSLGWALLWGALPALAGGPWWAWLAGFVWMDVVAMPALAPLVVLDDRWLIGEALLLTAAALPALALGHLTRVRSHARRQVMARASLQAVLFTGLFGWLTPTIAFRVDGTTWSDVVDHPYPVRSLLLTAAVVVAVPAVSAVAELARAGGTPYPWDPPTRLVTTGPYAYLANPMQVGATALMALLALAAGSPALGAAAGFALLFSIVLAERHERLSLTRRWPAYVEYRRHVRAWRPRWRPHVPTPATLWVREECTLCAATGATLQQLRPVGLVRRAAEDSPTLLVRMTWDDGADRGRPDAGIAAFARALEQTTLPWAWLGWFARLPGIRQVLQLIADACGLGPAPAVRTRPGPAAPTLHQNRGAR